MKVLVIEDDASLADMVRVALQMRRKDTQVLTAPSGKEGLDLFHKERPDLVLLDLGLPDIDGFDVCREIRRTSSVPLLIITVRDREVDMVRGLEMGADDYIPKPFSPLQLLARVQAVLRRSRPSLVSAEPPLEAGGLRIDFATQQVTVEGKPVHLTPVEFSILTYLAKNAGRVVPHQELVAQVWGSSSEDRSALLKVYIQRLRQKLGDSPERPRLILTRWRVGYQFLPTPEPSATP